MNRLIKIKNSKGGEEMSGKLRPVMIYSRKWNNEQKIMEKEKRFEAKFHLFGLAVEEDDRGFSSYSVAIVEGADGFINSIPLELVQFLDGDPDASH